MAEFLKFKGDKHIPLEVGDSLGIANGGHAGNTETEARTNLGLGNMAVRNATVSTQEPDSAVGDEGDLWLVIE